MDAEFEALSIYILSGTAGTGKSTVAYEFAKRLEDEGLLGASFFFIRGAEKFNSTRFVIPSLAVQLARNKPELYSHIVEASRTHIGLGMRQQLEFQLQDLFIKPLKCLPSDHPPLVIIIDAVDECTESGQNEVAHLLFLLMKNIHQVPFPLRVLFTTRPELHIEVALSAFEFRHLTKQFKLQDIPLDTVNEDISQFLEEGFVRFRFKKELAEKRPNAIAELTKRAEGLFIYASTARNFIFWHVDHPDDAVRKIDRLLSEEEYLVPAVNGQLDKLYLTVLDQAFPSYMLEQVNFTVNLRDSLASLALLQDHVSPRTLESLLGISTNDTTRILSRLGSVVQLSDNLDTEIRPIHASFPQFLIDNTRCTNPLFFINSATQHERFASVCLTILSGPRMVRENLQNTAPPHVQYACLHWATHLSLANPTPALFTLLHVFLTSKLLVWFEILSTIKRLNVAALALFRVRKWVQVSTLYGTAESKF